MRFPESGRYVVPGALEPIEVGREKDIGLYVEPNVGMRHSVVAQGTRGTGAPPTGFPAYGPAPPTPGASLSAGPGA